MRKCARIIAETSLIDPRIALNGRLPAPGRDLGRSLGPEDPVPEHFLTDNCDKVQPQRQQIGERGGSLARRRYQRGSVILKGKTWTGRWREDVMGSDGVVRRSTCRPPHRYAGGTAHQETGTSETRTLSDKDQCARLSARSCCDVGRVRGALAYRSAGSTQTVYGASSRIAPEDIYHPNVGVTPLGGDNRGITADVYYHRFEKAPTKDRSERCGNALRHIEHGEEMGLRL